MKKLARVLCTVLSLALCVSCFAMVGCNGDSGNGGDPDDDKTIIFSVQELDNVFNPYFSTSGYDSEIVGNTQISMLTSDKNAKIYCGDDEPTVAINYSQTIKFMDKTYNADDPSDSAALSAAINGEDPSNFTAEEYNTTYRFLLKNGIRFSDGEPLTVKDIIFNLYVLLDPAYYGSATVYSTAIDGLPEYRTQNPNANADTEGSLNERYRETAAEQVLKLRQIYHTDSAQRARFREGYSSFDYIKQNFLPDVEQARLMFYDEVMADWKSAKGELESYVEENKKVQEDPNGTVAKAAKEFTEVWEIFCYNYGLIGVETEKDENGNTVIKRYKEGDQLGYDKYGNKHKIGDKMIDYRQTWRYFHDADSLDLPITVFNNMAGVIDTGNIFQYENDGTGIKEIPNATHPNCDIITDEQGYAIGSKEKNEHPDNYWNQLYNGPIADNLYQIITFSATANKLMDKLISAARAKDLGTGDMEVPMIEGIKIIQYKQGDVFQGVNGPTQIDTESYGVEIKVDKVDPKALSNFGVTAAPMHYYSNVSLNKSLTQAERESFEKKDYDNFNYPVYDAQGNLLSSVPGIWDGSMANICPGLMYNSRDYLDKILKNPSIISVPVGAGMYQVSSASEADPYYLFEKSGNGDITAADLVNGQPKLKSNYNDVRHTFGEFDDDNIIYFIRNPFFFTTSGMVGNGDHITERDNTRNRMHNCYIKNVRYKIITSTKLLDSIIQGEVHYGDPTANSTNVQKIGTVKNLSQYLIDNNGYGYIGINATYVPDIEIRKAIMLALNTNLIMSYYGNDTASIITRSISTCSWASPANKDNPAYDTVLRNGDKYTKDIYAYNEATVKNEIANLINQVGASDTRGKYNTQTYPYERKLADGTTHKLEYTFTIAGSTDDHPAYSMMQNAMNILNECGFKISLRTDSMALSKLAAGTLTVWAAAWSSGADPDMYQVYHMDSKATSVNNWGYPTILANKASIDYKSQYDLIERLSDLIDEGRATLDQKSRAETYLDALNMILDLAVEYPTYQRKNLFVYRNDIIDRTSLNPSPTAFSGPLARMWDVKLL